MKRIFVFSLLFVAVCAWSDNSIQNKSQEAASPQQRSANKDAIPVNDTPSMPPRIAAIPDNRIVNPIDVPKTKGDAAKTQGNSSDKVPFIWGLTADEATAIFTLFLVVVGALTGGVLCWQACLLRQQIKLAREEFISSHRPRIIVRSFRIDMSEDKWIAGNQWPIKFSYVNVGDTTAIIQEIGVRVFGGVGPWTNGPSRDIRFEPQNVSKKLAVAEHEIYCTNDRFAIPNRTDIVSGTRWYCIGYIIYKDEIGINRKTGFCRKFNFEEQTWDRESDEDYDYCD